MKMLVIEQRDGSRWGVPVDVIARHRAARYAFEFGGDVDRSLAEDTLPLFEADPFEVQVWAYENMKWSHVSAHARMLTGPRIPDFEAAWMCGDKEVVEV